MLLKKKQLNSGERQPDADSQLQVDYFLITCPGMFHVFYIRAVYQCLKLLLYDL